MADYRPSAAARDALAEWAAVVAVASPWPGWTLRGTVMALVVPLGGGVFVSGHADPGPGAVPVDGGPWEAALGPLLWLPASSGEPLAGPSVQALSLHGVPTLFAVPGGGVAGLGPVLWAEAFRLHRRWVRRVAEPRLEVAYPVDDPVVSALATVEGRLLRDGGDARSVVLLRRERRGPLADEIAGYERAVETSAGLPAYVAQRVAAALGGGPTEAYRALDDLGTVSPRRRMEASGVGLALLLDRVSPGWHVHLAEGSVEALLDRLVVLDGGEEDDAILASVLGRYGYGNLLAACRARTDQALSARRSLVDQILTGDGSLLTFNVAALGQPRIESGEPAEAVNRSLSVFRGNVAFRFSGAELAFGDVPVAQDRRSGLLQARVPGRVRLAGDGRALAADEVAEFTDGFALEMHGIRVRARGGLLRSTEGGLYVEFRP